MSKAVRASLTAIAAAATVALCIVNTRHREAPAARPEQPGKAVADDPALALKRIVVPTGTRADLFAAEPLLVNPVCFCFDEQGRVYVAETGRLHAGATDNREHRDWLDDDLASRTVADRVAMFRKYLGKKFDSYAREQDRVVLLEDTKGTGRADKSTVFADGFNGHASGIGAGLLARGGDVWYACIPDLWRLRDTKGTGRADVKKVLHHGYGVHVAFLGHDLHGLKMGPDGRLYFSIGDRGLHVETDGRTVSCPDTGAVLRCNPDGSDLEIVATGLRNPQELAFDQYGNLFTGDNNADSGDAARWVYVVEGGDSGWRVGYQYLESPTKLGVWNAEKLWHQQHDGQAAYIVPPLAHIADGPSGLTYHPGVGLIPERYREHFFLCDFRGGSGGSGIHAFTLKPRGAAFELVGRERFAWSVLATDCDFGPDGGFYLSDWVEGWGKPNKGRIYKIHDPKRAHDALVAEVKQLLAEGMSKRPAAALYKLLEHSDMRVRQAAQFELVERDDGAGLVRGARELGKLGRLHAIWGLGQLHRKHPERSQVGTIAAFLSAGDVDVRCQALKTLGECQELGAFRAAVGELKADEARVRFFAALALGKMGKVDAIPPVCALLRENADKDPYLRHAAVMALTWLKDREALLSLAKDASPAVRLGALLAMRRLEMPEVAVFLNDPEPRLVLEAARSINDVPINQVMPQLAGLSERRGLADPVLYRVLNAHFRLGSPENARALAAFAARADAPAPLRVEALRMLGQWATPSGRDRVVGLWRALPQRPAGDAAVALRPVLGEILRGPGEVCAEGARAAGALGVKGVGPILLAQVADVKQPVVVRVETLKALQALNDNRLREAMAVALKDAEPRLRAQGRRVLAKLEPGSIVKALTPVLADGATVERQGALAILSELKQREADAVLARWLDRLLAGDVPAEIRLDLLEAAGRRKAAEVKSRLARYEASRPKDDPLAPYREALAGGDAEAGRRLFFHKTELSCLRCHKLKGEGGDVGPDLAGIGGKQTRAYLLESIVLPNKQIAKGYETVLLTLANGQVKTGILRSEDAKEVRLMTPEGVLLRVPRDEIDGRARGPSAMPADLIRHLSRTELRDLVEFLASLK